MTKLLRSLLHELRLASPDKTIKDSLAANYVLEQFKKYKTTDEQLCLARDEVKFLGNTYKTYLASNRKKMEIQATYKGKGERTVADTATMVGFKLPHDPK